MTLIHDRVDMARRGENPTVITRMASGWAVLGDSQFLPGYSLLVPDPVVDSLNDLDDVGRTAFLLDMAALGDAILCATDALRMNYSILGNSDAALHAHLHARYAHEPDPNRGWPPWSYGAELDSVPFDLARDAPLMERIRAELR